MTVIDVDLKRDWPVTRYIVRLRALRHHLIERYHIHELGVFGSYVRNQQRPDSDLDLLVSFTKTPSLLTLVQLEDELGALLGIKVDLAVKSALRPRIAARVLNELVVI
ncbi:MAG: nucleotidyltransferase family protein [Roseiflexaceae bacterium]|nr:nucleotidyltransferase family protein [Roseiflexaceae bacterium]